MKHVVVIGLDGMSWDILEKLFSKGVMGNVDIFRKKGVYGELNSWVPPFTVPRWTSIATGVNPGKHGAYAFLMPTENYGTRLTRSRDVRYPRVYEICTMQNLNSVVINLPLSYPPVILKGIMISDWIYPRFEVFPETARNLVKDYAPYDPLWSKRDPTDYVKAMLKGLERRIGVIKKLISKTKWSLFFVVFSEPDFLLHKLYSDILSGEGLAEEAYKVFDLIDNFIGWVVKNVPRDSLILLLSDHGFARYKYVIHVNKVLRDASLIKFKIAQREAHSSERINKQGDRIFVPKFLYRVMVKVESVRKIASLLFHTLFGNKIFPSYERVLDPYSSRARMHTETHFGIYINSKDVFPRWLISEDKIEKTQDFIMNLLSNIRNPDTNESVFECIYVRKKIFRGPYVKKLPHVIFFPKKEYWIDCKLREKTIEKKCSINHSMTGIFAAIGKDVKRGIKLGQLSIFDITPSILHALNLPIPHDTDGRVLFEMFDENSQIKQRQVRKANYLKRWNVIYKTKRSQSV